MLSIHGSKTHPFAWTRGLDEGHSREGQLPVPCKPQQHRRRLDSDLAATQGTTLYHVAPARSLAAQLKLFVSPLQFPAAPTDGRRRATGRQSTRAQLWRRPALPYPLSSGHRALLGHLECLLHCGSG
ncbi:hypothetical protein S40285_09805 [Stachybotrys chlorohalonatus IBT 40285]|uniref:Uncharacterized protein n=1 Tax=Stachybotrys chlorohalonatus (strain IBT 40285) TaxID=1283841 RepID=A0A084QZ47_STAC4|nr:hypothetical protein S40285_09805 [Stachybotrys chlorohalonata IBT 40285]